MTGEETNGKTMNRRVIGALLAGALCMATVAPAGAVNGGGSVAVQEEAPPETLTVKQMGLRAVERAVSENNASVQSLRKTAAGMDTGSSLSEQFEAQGGALELQIKQYQEMIGKMEEAMEQISSPSGQEARSCCKFWISFSKWFFCSSIL